MSSTATARRIRGKAEIRGILNTDREWHLYALADLDEELFAHCDWWVCGSGLALVFKALPIKPILISGSPEACIALLTAVPEQSGYLNLLPEHLEAGECIFQFRKRNEMYRMILNDFRPVSGSADKLSAQDCEEIQRLYSCGDDGGVAFAPFQLESGFFRGIWRQGHLVAVAGVHVVSTNERVAGVGNIFTHPEFRGQGLAQTVTSAVVTALLAEGIRTIGLNVERTNAPAIHAYTKLGFETRIEYYEGVADRRVS